MSLLFHDGFDACHSANGVNVDGYFQTAGWTQGFGSSSGGRLGTGKAIQQPRELYFSFPANLATVVVGVAEYWTGGGSNHYLLMFTDLGAVQIVVDVERTGRKIRVYRGNYAALLGETGINVAPDNAWNFWEVKATFHASAGSVIVRKNGVAVLTLTGVNTIATANPYADTVRVGANTSQYIDDFYCCDTAGAYNNDFLGDCASIVLNPDADSSVEEWTRSGGDDSWALVDEAPHNADADYIETGVDAQVTRFLYTDVPALDTVLGLTQHVVVKKTDTATAGIKLHQFVNATAYSGPEVILGTSYVGVKQLLETNPNTGVPWTPALVNAAEFGVEAVI